MRPGTGGLHISTFAQRLNHSSIPEWSQRPASHVLERGRFQGVGPLGAVHAVMCSSRRLSILQPTPLPANTFRARSLADCCIGRRSQVSIGNIFNTPKPNPRTHPAGVSRISSTACAYDACMKASLRFPPLQLYKLPGRGQLPEKNQNKNQVRVSG